MKRTCEQMKERSTAVEQMGLCVTKRSTRKLSFIWRHRHLGWNSRMQNLGLYSELGPVRGEGSLSCQTCCDMGPRFSRSHLKDPPPLKSTDKGYWGPNLTRIPFGWYILNGTPARLYTQGVRNPLYDDILYMCPDI